MIWNHWLLERRFWQNRREKTVSSTKGRQIRILLWWMRVKLTTQCCVWVFVVHLHRFLSVYCFCSPFERERRLVWPFLGRSLDGQNHSDDHFALFIKSAGNKFYDAQHLHSHYQVDAKTISDGDLQPEGSLLVVVLLLLDIGVHSEGKFLVRTRTRMRSDTGKDAHRLHLLWPIRRNHKRTHTKMTSGKGKKGRRSGKSWFKTNKFDRF